MNTKIKVISFGVIALFLPIISISAQVLENVPGQSSVGSGDLIGYLDNLYRFGIAITGILAVFMIALGAFSYIVTSAGNSSKMMNAKEMINNALIGLVIVLTAYLFLYVINPDLVGGTLTAPEEIVENVTITSPGGGGSPALADGTPCNDGSALPACPACPHCAICENGYHTNASGDQVCGPSPSATAPATATGCCVWDSNKQCNNNLTKADCENFGESHFTVGPGLTCENQSKLLGIYFKCK